jgi:hypothetical protein
MSKNRGPSTGTVVHLSKDKTEFIQYMRKEEKDCAYGQWFKELRCDGEINMKS